MERTIFVVRCVRRPNHGWRRGNRWQVFARRAGRRGEVAITGLRTRQNAVEFAVLRATDVFDPSAGMHGAQVVLHRMDGRIAWERTYPDLTPRRKG